MLSHGHIPPTLLLLTYIEQGTEQGKLSSVDTSIHKIQLVAAGEAGGVTGWEEAEPEAELEAADSEAAKLAVRVGAMRLLQGTSLWRTVWRSPPPSKRML